MVLWLCPGSEEQPNGTFQGMMGQQSIVKCLSPLRDVGDWTPSTRGVESHSDQSAYHSFLSTTSRYEKFSSQSVKLWAILGALDPMKSGG